MGNTTSESIKKVSDYLVKLNQAQRNAQNKLVYDQQQLASLEQKEDTTQDPKAHQELQERIDQLKAEQAQEQQQLLELQKERAQVQQQQKNELRVQQSNYIDAIIQGINTAKNDLLKQTLRCKDNNNPALCNNPQLYIENNSNDLIQWLQQTKSFKRNKVAPSEDTYINHMVNGLFYIYYFSLIANLDLPSKTRSLLKQLIGCNTGAIYSFLGEFSSIPMDQIQIRYDTNNMGKIQSYSEYLNELCRN